eukprot:4408021-Prymnesium_polylepis.1
MASVRRGPSWSVRRLQHSRSRLVSAVQYSPAACSDGGSRLAGMVQPQDEKAQCFRQNVRNLRSTQAPDQRVRGG